MEGKRLPQLIERYKLQIATTLCFILLVAQVPLLYFNVLPNIQLKLMAMRCLVLDTLSTALFLLFEKGKFKELLPFPLSGTILSLDYLKTGNFFLLPFCISVTATSVIMVALTAYISIKVNYGKR